MLKIWSLMNFRNPQLLDRHQLAILEPLYQQREASPGSPFCGATDIYIGAAKGKPLTMWSPVYPTVFRLEKKGLIQSSIDLLPGSGRYGKRFEITPKGSERLNSHYTAMHQRQTTSRRFKPNAN
jgi:DNA-binding MarR family transcriptional regulator